MPWPFSWKSAAVLNGEMVESSASPHSRFAFRLFRELSRGDNNANVFFSPSSVMLCLMLVRELASGETRAAMAKTLEISGLDLAGIEREIASLKLGFEPRADAELAVANALFLGRHAEVGAALKAQLHARYDAELTKLDFASPEAIATINAWVNDKTRRKIREIVKEISALAALAAVNAVYFKSLWLKPFQRELTQDRPFRTAFGTKKVRMMSQGDSYRYFEDREVQVAALPYRGGISMYIVLPATKADPRGFQHSLNSGLWESWIARSHSMPGMIQLPQFRVDYEAELKGALCALGMERVFDQNRAQFEHVQTDLPPVWLDRVTHRAVAEVNEEGTEAAAATIAHMVFASAMRSRPPKQFQMIVDHPFLAVIRDETRKVILFMGWIASPQ